MYWFIILAAILVATAVVWWWLGRRRSGTPTDPTYRHEGPNDIRGRVEHQAFMGDRLRNRYRSDGH
ncbi:hypothetical protein [Nocardioides ungokensis]|uniref:hypothetical protein n=1 Tax=Nocardioides ungokensis TaxID=1643322 RepID=UPI0015DDCA8D|nr:hypothetical protein [Nocardioides ungokensis]